MPFTIMLYIQEYVCALPHKLDEILKMCLKITLLFHCSIIIQIFFKG